ncbi:MAG: glycoside hydrolase family 99-like domain-containing protein [Nodosilinea sp.]
MNYLLVSHCSFNGNSCIQAYHIAATLVELGFDCAISVPDAPESVFEVFRVSAPPFKVITHGTTHLDGLFDDGRGADVIHCFTPRQHVRNETLRLADYYQAPYVVHLEDNEEDILRTELGIDSLDFLQDLPLTHLAERIPPWRIWPGQYQPFLAQAAGVTALVDRLLEFNLAQRPELVFWPGFDPNYLQTLAQTEARRRFSLPEDGPLLVYAGAVHAVNAWEVETLVLAVAELNRRGHRVRLVKAGNDAHPLFTTLPQPLADVVINLGFVNRVDLPQLLQAADVLVQPGQANPFNDYRFPSKLPEYFATGKPVVLPRTNVGLHIADGVEGVLLNEGHYRDIADCVERLLADPTWAAAVGAAGRALALRELTWATNVGKIHDWLIDLMPRSQPEPAPFTAAIDPTQTADPKLIAFYLPQFHPIPENDRWWGEGFTEWTNVRRGQPSFEGHYQPRLPADLGYYDLRHPEVMERQAAIAQRYGIYGFCFYYYWFDGQRLLERPVDTWLSRGQSQMPFCLCWANESWTRRWDGQDQEILMEQTYPPGWVEQFFADILPYLKDDRYIRVGGEPMLVLYRMEKIPYAEAAIQAWKQLARQAGLGGLHIVGVQYIDMAPEDVIKLGADATVEFPPHLPLVERPVVDLTALPGLNPDFGGFIEDYPAAMARYLARPAARVPWYRGLMPSWDNTARRGLRGHVYIDASPQLYEQWLRYLIDYSRCAENGQSIIFVNAWNEWAEGAYLEPDDNYGWQYLEATGRALRGYTPIRQVEPYQPPRPLVREPRPWGNSPDLAFCNSAFVARVRAQYPYGQTRWPALSYASVRDYCDSWESLNPLANHGDLKNVQRPWALKAVLSEVPPGGKILEFGGGHPLIAAALVRLGYDVTIVDPYDGTGNGPTEYEHYVQAFPEVRIIRGYFRPDMPDLAGEQGSFDAVYSISVIEHVPFAELRQIFAAMRRYLSPVNGLSIHAIDLILKGDGDADHRQMLKVLTEASGLSEAVVNQVLGRMESDAETYYLSAEAHNAWRGSQTYDQFPMRVCVSLQLCTRATQLTEAPWQRFEAEENQGLISSLPEATARFDGKSADPPHLATPGRCPICGTQSEAQFVATHPWLRDFYLCQHCHTCPRQRAMVLILSQLLPHWRELQIHEGSPCIPYFAQEAKHYTSSYYFDQIRPGETDPATGLRCENFEALTFADSSFDIFMHQDVLEHVFNPDQALREAMRVLKPGGLHIFTVPKNKRLLASEPRARLTAVGVEHLKPAEYHVDPKDDQGALVTWDYGADIADMFSAFGGYLVSTYVMRDRRFGIDGDYLEVFYAWKVPENQLSQAERRQLLLDWPHGSQHLSRLPGP